MFEPDTRHVAPNTLLFFFGFLVFTAVSGSLLCGLWVNISSIQSVLQNGTETDAVLSEKYVDDAGQYWFSYHFETANGNIYHSSIQVNESSYHSYEAGDILPMRYVPTNPGSNVLTLLESDIQGNSRLLAGLSVLVTLIAGALAFGWMRTIPGKWLPPKRAR